MKIRRIIIKIISIVFLVLNIYLLLTYIDMAMQKNEILATFKQLGIELPSRTKISLLFLSTPFYFYIFVALILIIKEWWIKREVMNLLINIVVFLILLILKVFIVTGFIVPMYEMLKSIK